MALPAFIGLGVGAAKMAAAKGGAALAGKTLAGQAVRSGALAAGQEAAKRGIFQKAASLPMRYAQNVGRQIAQEGVGGAAIRVLPEIGMGTLASMLYGVPLGVSAEQGLAGIVGGYAAGGLVGRRLAAKFPMASVAADMGGSIGLSTLASTKGPMSSRYMREMEQEATMTQRQMLEKAYQDGLAAGGGVAANSIRPLGQVETSEDMKRFIMEAVGAQ